MRRSPFALRVAATATILALAVTACSADGGDSSESPSSGVPASGSVSASSASAAVSISGAPQRLSRAVVTSGDDVTLAVRPKGRRGWKVVGGWWPSLGASKGAADLGGARHVPVVGSDARPGERVTSARADALQLLEADGKGGAGIMGFARDLWVPIPGHGHGKLNSSMVFAGPSGQVESVSSISGIDIDGYVVTGFEGFKEIVDGLGGLNFIAPEDLRSHLAGGRLDEGYNHLDGTEALAYARERKTLPGGDFDRSRHQGLLLASAAIQARLRGPGSLPEALSVLDEHASSDLSAQEMLLFTANFYRVDPSRVGHEVARGPTGMQSGQSIVRLDDGSKAAFRDFRDGRLS